jgi:hypothetical protein
MPSLFFNLVMILTLRADIVGGTGPIDGFELNLRQIWESYET